MFYSLIHPFIEWWSTRNLTYIVNVTHVASVRQKCLNRPPETAPDDMQLHQKLCLMRQGGNICTQYSD